MSRTITLDEEEYEALEQQAIQFMELDDTIEMGIRKLLRKFAGIDSDERTKERVINEIPEEYREPVSQFLESIEENYEIVIELPSQEAWESKYKYRWITLKKKNPRTRRDVLCKMSPRGYGFLLEIADLKNANTKKRKKYRVGKDVMRFSDISEGCVKAFSEAYNNF